MQNKALAVWQSLIRYNSSVKPLILKVARNPAVTPVDIQVEAPLTEEYIDEPGAPAEEPWSPAADFNKARSVIQTGELSRCCNLYDYDRRVRLGATTGTQRSAKRAGAASAYRVTRGFVAQEVTESVRQPAIGIPR